MTIINWYIDNEDNTLIYGITGNFFYYIHDHTSHLELVDYNYVKCHLTKWVQI